MLLELDDVEGNAEEETATRFVTQLEDKWPSKQVFKAVFQDMNTTISRKSGGMSSESSGPPTPITAGGKSTSRPTALTTITWSPRS